MPVHRFSKRRRHRVSWSKRKANQARKQETKIVSPVSLPTSPLVSPSAFPSVSYLVHRERALPTQPLVVSTVQEGPIQELPRRSIARVLPSLHIDTNKTNDPDETDDAYEPSSPVGRCLSSSSKSSPSSGTQFTCLELLMDMTWGRCDVSSPVTVLMDEDFSTPPAASASPTLPVPPTVSPAVSLAVPPFVALPDPIIFSYPDPHRFVQLLKAEPARQLVENVPESPSVSVVRSQLMLEFVRNISSFGEEVLVGDVSSITEQGEHTELYHTEQVDHSEPFDLLDLMHLSMTP